MIVVSFLAAVFAATFLAFVTFGTFTFVLSEAFVLSFAVSLLAKALAFSFILTETFATIVFFVLVVGIVLGDWIISLASNRTFVRRM